VLPGETSTAGQDRGRDELPVEEYVYRRTDTGACVVVRMTVAERVRREFLPGRILLEDGVLAERDLEAEALSAPAGTLDLAHLLRLRAQLDALGS